MNSRIIGPSVLVLLGASIKAVGVGIVLSGTAYTETFDGLGSGLPTGWSVKTGATSTALGSDATYASATTSWATTTGNFRNAASADGLLSTTSTSAQAGSTDRALAIRQTGSFGDPGAAFLLSIQDTLGFEDFSLSFKAQLLSHQGYSTTWAIDYRLGNSGTFSTLGTFADPGAFGSTTLSFNSTQLAAWNDQAEPVYFRIAALSPATGSGSRDTFGIDDFSLTFSAVQRAVPDTTSGAAWLGSVCLMMLWLARKGRR